MPAISKTAEILPASPIRKLAPVADAAKKRGTKVYHLNIGQPDIATPQCAMKALKNLDTNILEYTHSAGNISYREALAEFYSARTTPLTHQNILVTTGGSEAILFSLLATCNPGDEIIIPEPFYANYNSFAIEAGAVIKPIAAHIEDGYALPAIAKFEELITPKTKAILICNPNNPTGYLYTPQEITALRDLVLKHNIFLIADEVYSDFCYDGKQHFSVLDLQGVEQNIIMVDSVSKRYSMCGARIGALVTRNMQIIDAALKMGQARLCAPYIGQIAAEAATRETKPEYFTQVHDQYIARRDYTVESLNKMAGVLCPKPGGAFYAMVRLPIDNAETFSRWMLEEFSHNGATVMLSPAQGFYSNPCTCPQNEVRIAYVLKLEDLKAAMEILAKALQAYPNRTI